MTQPLVSVVIPTLNAGASFGRLLAAIWSQQVPGELEILIVDSASKDGTLELARDTGARIVSVERRSFQHGRTRNKAIQACRGQIVALTVQDALPADDHWLARLMDPLLGQESVAGSYGLQVAPSSAGLLARTRSALWCEAHDKSVVRSLAGLHEFREMEAEQRLEAVRFDNVTSCLRRSVWERLPFPEQRYGEDMAWAKGVLLAGYQVAFVPSARVWHSHERGWLYELRRAYAEGLARVLIVDWPVTPLGVGDAWSALRRLLFFLRTHRFDPTTDPDVARRFLQAELRTYEPLAQSGSRPAQLYEASLRFCRGMTDTAAQLCAEGIFPEETWVRLLRFAMVTIVGQHLGSNAERALQAPALERLAWAMLHLILNRSV